VDWFELSVKVGRSAVPVVAGLFDRYVSGGAVIETSVDCFEYDLPAMPLPDLVVVKGYLPADSTAEDARQRLERGLWLLRLLHPIGEAVVRHVGEADWIDAWKQQFRLQRVGRNLVIVPEWEAYTPSPGEAVIQLEPGMAFGTGLHSTTRLCLAALESYLHPGSTVLDVGTGSGVLAIAAAKLGARSVLAIDADPVAAAVARENVARNGVAAAVKVQHGSLPGGMLEGQVPAHFTASGPVSLLDSGCFDLVLVNILAPIIIGMAPSLSARLADPPSRRARDPRARAHPGSEARIIAAGLIESQEAEVAHALQAQGLEVIDRAQEHEWVSLVARRR
jgi:ribosomal protein L11 methyltransferase